MMLAAAVLLLSVRSMPRAVVRCSVASAGPETDALLREVQRAAEAAVKVTNYQGKERDGSWCVDQFRQDLLASMSGLRCRKLAWWLDAPRPLRAVTARGDRFEIAVIALPGGSSIEGAAYPNGAIILAQPLLGEVQCRRVRLEQGRSPVEMMRRKLRNVGEDAPAPLMLSGGCCHEWSASPGIGSAFLQAVLLPPDSSFPAGGCGVGWRRPPSEGCEFDADFVLDAVIDGLRVTDLLLVERPPPRQIAKEEPVSTGDAPALVSRLRRSVGGLDAPLSIIVRRALASRLYPPALAADLGLPPVRGLLLYGPPGCGKTLVAREIASALGARQPKIVSGPEMMSKYVGDSEAFIRGLFGDAELEQAERGDDSALHVIVLDELDAYARDRGSLRGDTSGIRDSVVNQLLAKMDGVEPLNNVLVVGMTNRPELIDPALLRPGRMEVHVRIDAPDTNGRQQILNIHTARLRERGCLAPDAAAALRSGALAAATHGYSGADLAGLIRAASAFALERYADLKGLSGWAGLTEPDGGATKPAGLTKPGRSATKPAGHGAPPAASVLEVRLQDVRALRPEIDRSVP
mmetsp:Transcript_29857/g.96365  ORF Transcript_29857/g.96365 Transcript_29857/m.96365 type:complete len:576 (-) Transcript_29857:369-2096(-)